MIIFVSPPYLILFLSLLISFLIFLLPLSIPLLLGYRLPDYRKTEFGHVLKMSNKKKWEYVLISICTFVLRSLFHDDCESGRTCLSCLGLLDVALSPIFVKPNFFPIHHRICSNIIAKFLECYCNVVAVLLQLLCNFVL